MRAWVLAMALLLAGCTAPASEPLPTGQIDGAVLGSHLQPFGNVTVRLVELDREDRTSTLGGFTFDAVPPGLYTLTVDIPGIGSDAETLRVGSKVARVILQVIPEPGPGDEVLSFTHTHVEPLALPGEPCTCRWSTGEVPDEADALFAEASWHAWVGQLPGTIRIDVHAGDLLVTTFKVPGDGRLHGVEVPRSELAPHLGSLEVRATFLDDVMPQPDLQLDLRLLLLYEAPS